MKLPAVVALLSLPPFLGLALASCAQVLGADDYAVSCKAPLAVFDAQAPGCAECLRAHCNQEETACTQNAACAEALCCYAGCGYSSCRVNCTPADDAAGRVAYESLFQCRTNCREECAMGQHWSCVGQVAFPDEVGTVTERLGIEDLVSMTPVGGITAKACGDLDYACGMALTNGTSDDAGVVELTVPRGFKGFVWLADPTGAYLPTIYVTSDPVETSSPLGAVYTLPLITTMDLDYASATTNITLTPGTAEVAYIVYDCIGDTAPGVAVTLTVQSQTLDTSFYLHNDAPMTSPPMTDQSGLGAIVNAPGGTGMPVLGELHATLVSNQQILARQLVVLYGDKFTLVRLAPTPL